MYNRYFQAEEEPVVSAPRMGGEAPPAAAAEPAAFQTVEAEEAPPEKAKGLGALKSLFGGSVKLPDFDADTVLLLVLVYFLVADNNNEHISDTMLIIGMLLLLGF